MEVKYQFFESEKLIVQKFIGPYTFEEHISYTKFITPFLIGKSIEKVLNDMRNLNNDDFEGIPSNLSNVIEKVTQFRKKIVKNDLKNMNVIIAFWAEDPLPVLISHIFTNNFSNKDYSYFTCKEEVTRYLQLPDNFDLDSITQNLQNTFKSE